jgi:hypothetical protein
MKKRRHTSLNMKVGDHATLSARDNTSLIDETLKTSNVGNACLLWLPKLQTLQNAKLLKLLGVQAQATKYGGIDATHQVPLTHTFCPAVPLFDPLESLLNNPFAATCDMVVPV